MSPRLMMMLCFLRLSILPGSGQTDDFEDGNDADWSRLDPIGQVTGSPFAVYQVQGGQYRLSCEVSPDAQFGPARVSSLREDANYGDFVVVVDVVSWDDSLDQAFGILARIQDNPGIGAVDGYSMNYQPGDHDIEINRLTGEAPLNLARVEVDLVPGGSYRFVFCGNGEELRGAVFSLSDPLVPLVTITAFDSLYANGYCGLFGFDASDTGAVDVTFDGYSASAPSVPVLGFAATGTDFAVSWPRGTGAWHLESSTDLQLWTDVTEDGTVAGGVLRFQAPVPSPGRKFYRLAEGWAVVP